MGVYTIRSLQSPQMDAIEYMAGLALVGAVVGGFWLTARRLRRLLVPGWGGAPATLGELVLATRFYPVGSVPVCAPPSGMAPFYLR